MRLANVNRQTAGRLAARSDPDCCVAKESLSIPQGIARVRGNGFDRKCAALALLQTLVTKQGDECFVLGSFTDMLPLHSALKPWV